MNARLSPNSSLYALIMLVVSAGVVFVGCDQRYKPANYRAAPRDDGNSQSASDSQSENKRKSRVPPLPRVTDWTSPSSIGKTSGEFSTGGYRGYSTAPYRGAGNFGGAAYRGYNNGGSTAPYRGYSNGGSTAPYRGYTNRYRNADTSRPYRGNVSPYGNSNSNYGKPAVYRGYQDSDSSSYRGYKN